ASAGFLWFTEQRMATVRQQAAAMDTRTDALIGGLSDLSTALQAYVAPGQNITEWSKRAAALLTQLTSDASALGAATDATDALAMVGPGIETLTKLDARVRDYLRSGDDLMAADLAFTEARDTTAGMVSGLRDWRARRQASVVTDVRSAQVQQAAALGGILLAWVLSLVVVSWGRRAAPAGATDAATAIVAEAPAADILALSLDRTVNNAPAPDVDLAIAAVACGDFARATDGAGLRSALGRGAEALGAKGIVVWLGVGEELFAVASHGYDERHLKRPISRDAKNVTAEAWRTAEAQLVPGEAAGPGVVVVPMVGSGGCRGVVSAELLPTHAANADRQALLSMFAAQIEGLVGTAPTQAPDVATVEPVFVEPAAASQAG
ncbi:MAG: hypothetical protein Q7J25_00230, partial [Vicinamibacterales bacterium]|nr:hypothetical protein [Vicinamibacterales bacterium]